MQKVTPNNTNKKVVSKLRHEDEFASFVVWVATPKELRDPKTQAELAQKFGVGQDTLSDWKKRDGFYEKVAKVRKSWGRDRTPDVIHALYRNIMKTGSVQGVKLWLQYFEDWMEKTNSYDPANDPIRQLSDKELMAEIRKAQNFFRKKD